MRYMDYLKPKPEVIEQDDKRYEFTPGKGNLMKAVPLNVDKEEPRVQPKAKVVPMKPPQTPIGSVRG